MKTTKLFPRIVAILGYFGSYLKRFYSMKNLKLNFFDVLSNYVMKEAKRSLTFS
jgi:hypothetical protein